MGTFDNVFTYSLAGGSGSEPATQTTVQWDFATKGTNLTLSNTNLTVTSTSGASSIKATKALTGKKYWEIKLVQGLSGFHHIGIASLGLTNNQYIGQTANSWAYESFNKNKWNNQSPVLYAPTAGTSNDIIGVAFDADTGTLEFFKNGITLGVAYSGIPQGIYYPAVSHNNTTNTLISTAAFANFIYTPPSGFSAIA
jgi:SPRY domain